MSWEGGTLKMDATAGERSLHLPGSTYLYFDASKQVYKQDQLRVSWKRK